MSLQRMIRLGAMAVGGLAIAVGGLGVYAWTQRAPHAVAGAPVEVTVTDRGCQPSALSVAAGRVTFQIVNRSERALEWEILDGVMVVDERENIAPGLTQRLATRLEPGEYAITCGLLSNPRGRLTVTPSAGDAHRRPDPVALIGPMAEYKVFVVVGAMDLAEATDALADAVERGDRDAAESALADARALYGRIRPATKMLFADLDTAIDANADAFPDGAADPGFTGFRKLAIGLAEGPLASMRPLTQRLNADVHILNERLTDATISPSRMVAGALLLLNDTGLSERGRDPAVIAANLDGAEKIADLLKPLTRKADPAMSDRLDATFAAARQELGAGQSDRTALHTLAAEFDTLRATLGLDG